MPSVTRTKRAIGCRSVVRVACRLDHRGWTTAMHPGELIYHFINTIIVAAIVSAAVLWRYRIGVVAGMRVRGGSDLVPPMAGAKREHGEFVAGTSARVWEKHLRARIVAAMAALVMGCALPFGYAWLQGEIEGLTPLHVFARSAGYGLA